MIGTEVDVDVLGEVAGVEEHVLLDAIDAGLLAGLVTEPGAGRIRFAHALVRDTLYHGLSRLRRSRLHARAGEAIERHSPGQVAALAYHFAEAGTDPVKAARYCGLAAAQAEQVFAYPEAARLWEQAIACLDQAGGAPDRERLELVLGLVRALAHTGQLARARSYRHDAVRAALPLDDPVLLARVITAFDVPRLWFSHEYGETDDELVGMVEQTLARLPPGDQPLRCRLLTTLAFELEGAESERGYQASAQAVEMARRLGDPGAADDSHQRPLLPELPARRAGRAPEPGRRAARAARQAGDRRGACSPAAHGGQQRRCRLRRRGPARRPGRAHRRPLRPPGDRHRDQHLPRDANGAGRRPDRCRRALPAGRRAN